MSDDGEVVFLLVLVMVVAATLGGAVVYVWQRDAADAARCEAKCAPLRAVAAGDECGCVIVRVAKEAS